MDFGGNPEVVAKWSTWGITTSNSDLLLVSVNSPGLQVVTVILGVSGPYSCR